MVRQTTGQRWLVVWAHFVAREKGRKILGDSVSKLYKLVHIEMDEPV